MGSHTQSGSEDTPGLFSADSKEPSIMTRTILLTFGLLTLVSTAPQNFGRNNRRGYNNNNNPNTKFFTNNRPLNDAIAGAAIGFGTQYVANNIFNPCRDRNRYNTNNRIFGANNGCWDSSEDTQLDRSSTMFRETLVAEAGNDGVVSLTERDKSFYTVLLANC